jgi:hemoglobin
MTAPTMYDRVGGRTFFERLVAAFYDGVAGDDVLAPLYPEHPDFSGARHRLTLFLVQYWGGPADYAAERGHPQLRMRHLRFPIDTVARDHWLAHMSTAVASVIEGLEAGDDVAAELLAYFFRAAEHLRNDTGLPITSASFRPPE